MTDEEWEKIPEDRKKYICRECGGAKSPRYNEEYVHGAEWPQHITPVCKNYCEFR